MVGAGQVGVATQTLGEAGVFAFDIGRSCSELGNGHGSSPHHARTQI